MSTVNVIKSSLDSIQQISEHLHEAVVYLDAGCTESFQFIGAFSLLLEYGARAVCCLENMSPLDMVADWNGTIDSATKVVVITSCLLSDVHRYVLRCLGAHPSIQHCCIFTSISEIAHSAYPDSPLGPDAFREYESLLIQDYEELLNKHKTKSERLDEKNLLENLASEEGWAQLDDKDISHVVTSPSVSSVNEDNLKQREQVLAVSVQHFPMIYCPLSPNFFVLPSGGSVAQASLSAAHEHSLSPGLPPLSTGLASDGEDVPGATLTAHFLYYLASKMDLKLEIFSFGDQSKIVGRLLTDMSSLYDVGRRKRSAGLLLIDRTLDLLTPCSHTDSFFDRVYSALPRREKSPSMHARNSQAQANPNTRVHRAPLDVRIPLDNVFKKDYGTDNFQLLQNFEAFLQGWNSSSTDSKIRDLIDLSNKIQDEKSSGFIEHLFDGSFMAAESFHGTPYLEAVLGRRMKDGSVLVKKWLQETLRKENISVNVKTRPGSATKSELEPMIKALATTDSSFLKNKGVIQLAAATVVALEDLHSDKWNAFISAEKMLHVSAGDTSQSLASQIGDLINKSFLTRSQGGKSKSSQGLISFKDALLLTITGYILAGENFPSSGSTSPFSWQEEHLMKEAIVDAIIENPELSELKFIQGLAEDLEAYRSKISSKELKATEELSLDDFDGDGWGEWGDEDADSASNKEQGYDDMQLKLELRDRVDSLFRFFYKLSGLKSRNAPLRKGSFTSEVGFGGDSFENKGLLYKLLLRALGKYDVPGLEHHSSAVGRLFGRFGLGQAKPSLADQNIILVFVIGGTNGQEVHEAFEALSETDMPNIELIVGGTTLLTPDDMFELLLGNSSYF
ncbi:sec1 family domain-containing protein MIP3-like [Chenopodium quinoa]|uniref:sec1 family domain-containing protein MIP3-like n=1 Tax=Chenopodium quinoa TaxID=63459 RepID=UPI000B77C23F|nr:sec1 family domain-containing protein MIP3-like [Chenopodium quinoa]